MHTRFHLAKIAFRFEAQTYAGGASKEEIKSAYRQLALKYHPDVDKSQEAWRNPTGYLNGPAWLGAE